MATTTKLRVNIKSLASEARYIRKESNRVKRKSGGNDPDFRSLDSHRRWNVRNESRAAQLLYAFLRRVPYRHVETAPDHSTPAWGDTVMRVKRKCNLHKIPYEDVGAWLSQTSIGV